MDSPAHEKPHVRLDRYLSGDRGRAAALARRCDVTEATVSGWRRGHIRPSGDERRAAIEEMTGIERDAWETARPLASEEVSPADDDERPTLTPDPSTPDARAA